MAALSRKELQSKIVGQRLESRDWIFIYLFIFPEKQLEEQVQTGITILVDFWTGLFCMSFNMQVLIKPF